MLNRIKQLCQEQGNKTPKITEQSDFIDWEFYRNKNTAVETAVETEILRLIEHDPKITANTLASELNINKRTIETNLAILKSRLIIKRVGPNKGGRWQKIIL